MARPPYHWARSKGGETVSVFQTTRKLVAETKLSRVRTSRNTRIYKTVRPRSSALRGNKMTLKEVRLQPGLTIGGARRRS
jgi:hypothetical protein